MGLENEQMEQALKQAGDEAEKKMTYFLKKKGLYHIKEDMDKKEGKFLEALKQHDCTLDDAWQGMIPQELIPMAEDYFISRRNATLALKYNLGKAQKNNEFGETFDTEYKSHAEVEQKREIDEQAYAEAIEAYKEYPSKAATQKMIKARMVLDGTGIDGVIKRAGLSEAEKINSANRALLEKYTKATVESGAKEGEKIEKLKKSPDGGERRMGEFLEKQVISRTAMEADREFEEQERAAKEKTWKES